ncbi:putative secreted protein with PEP-CTERM sorting signal [Chthoniobacter flavus]|nr:hypothetical protein [Chthoniobacter flavus]TCO89945.1 putative secreted protein with PEP-CTERM sorting signal [Chthoniobacter flavus]
MQGTNTPPAYNQTSPTGPLGTTLSAPYGDVSATFGFGTIDIQAAATEDNQGFNNASANGDWRDTLTINDPALTGMQGVARFTYHLSGSVNATTAGLEDVNSNFSLTLPSGANYQGGYYSNNNGYQGYQVSDLGTVTDDVGFTFGTPFDISVGFGAGVSILWDHQSSAGDVSLSLDAGGLTVLSGTNPVDPSSYTTSSISGTDYAVPTPEPSTWTALLGGFGMLLGFQRGKRPVTKKG